MITRKKTLALSFIIAFAMTLVVTNPMIVKASGYKYQVSIALGDISNASFDTSAISTEGTINVDDNILTISDLPYKGRVSFIVSELVKIDSDAAVGSRTYFVKGLRGSGNDQNLGLNINLSVQGDESYVIAYGVGDVVSYTVKYQDESGNSLFGDEELFAAKGEVLRVPARHIEGYMPNTLYLTKSEGLTGNAADDIFTFIYKKVSASTQTVTNNIEETRYSTVMGDPLYEYQYQTRYITGPATQIGQAEAADPVQAGQDNNADQNVDDNSTRRTVITDEDVPLDIIDIDEGEVPLEGGKTPNLLFRNMIIAVLLMIFGFIASLITVFKSLEIVNNRNRDDDD